MKIHLPVCGPVLPFHPTRVHPRTGQPLQAVGVTRRGQLMWPVLGASPDDPSNDDSDGGDDDSRGDAPPELGDAGKQAIDRMKAERNAAQAELRTVKEQLDKLSPLQKLAEALGGQGTGDQKTDLQTLTDRLSNHESELAKERAARTRAEVIAEKQLSPRQAKRLIGTTREELAADADEILRDFPEAPANGGRPGGPRPDPSQGSRGGTPKSGREAAVEEAKKRFGRSTAAT